MTLFIDTRELADLVHQVGLTGFVAGLADYVRQDLLRWEAFEKSARVASHSATGVIELMPTSDGELFSFKYVNGHPANPSSGKLTVGAFGVLADVRSGYPLLLSEMTVLTAFRTAATSVVAAQVLARAGSQSMALIGAGAQAEFQALTFHAVLKIAEFHTYDVDDRAVAKLQRNLADHGISVYQAKSAVEAALASDIVTTATADKRRAIVLPHDGVKPGHHLNAIGGDCPGKTELDPRTLKSARIFVEYEPQTRVEGEIQALGDDSPVVELWQVLNGRKRGRQLARDITVFDSVGFAIEDFSTLRYVFDLAQQYGAGREIALIPELADPKDLYAALKRSVENS